MGLQKGLNTFCLALFSESIFVTYSSLGVGIQSVLKGVSRKFTLEKLRRVARIEKGGWAHTMVANAHDRKRRPPIGPTFYCVPETLKI